MAVDRGMVSRSTGPKVQGLEGLIAAQQANQQRQNQLLSQVAKNMEKEQKELATQAASLREVENEFKLPNAIFQSAYHYEEEVVVDLLNKKEITYTEGSDRLQRTYAFLLGAEDDDALALLETRKSQFGTEDGYNDFDKSLGVMYQPIDKVDFAMETNSRRDFINGGYYGATKEDFTKATQDPTHFQNFIQFDENGIPSFVNTFDMNGDVAEQNKQMSESQYYGNLAPVLGEEFFREQATSRGFDSYYSRIATLEKNGDPAKGINQGVAREATTGFLSDPDDELSTQARLTAFYYIMENPEDDPKLDNLLQESDFIDFVTWRGTKPGEKNRDRFNNIVQIPELLDNYIPDVKQQVQVTSVQKRRNDKLGELETDSNLFPISNSGVTAASFPVSLSNVNNYVEFNTGEIGKGSALNPIRFENPNWGLDPYKFQDGERVMAVQFGDYPKIAEPILGPKVYSIKPEQLRIYNSGDDIIIGLQSFTKNQLNPEIFIKYNSNDPKDVENQSLLERAIDEGYKGSLKLEDFIEAGRDKLGVQTQTQLSFPKWKSQQPAGSDTSMAAYMNFYNLQ